MWLEKPRVPVHTQNPATELLAGGATRSLLRQFYGNTLNGHPLLVMDTWVTCSPELL